MLTKLKAARTAKKLTQADLAFYSRVSPADISKFESGMARPYPAQAERIVAVLSGSLRPLELNQPGRRVAPIRENAAHHFTAQRHQETCGRSQARPRR